jgi:hypothetical protein
LIFVGSAWRFAGWGFFVGVCLLLLGVGAIGCCIKGEAFGREIFSSMDVFFRRMLRPYDGWGIIFVGDGGLMGI